MTTLYYLSISIAAIAALFLFFWVREIIKHDNTQKELEKYKFMEGCLKWKISEQEKVHDRLLTKLRENGVEVGELK